MHAADRFALAASWLVLAGLIGGALHAIAENRLERRRREREKP